jgi:hypothetical protein
MHPSGVFRTPRKAGAVQKKPKENLLGGVGGVLLVT